MERLILRLTQIRQEEWLSNDQEKIQFLSDGIVVSQCNEECMLTYWDRKGLLKHLLDRPGINTYEMRIQSKIVGDLEVKVGVSRYYMNGISEASEYEIEKPIRFLSEGIEGIYLTLKLRGSGKLTINQWLLQGIDPIYWHEGLPKVKKVQQFYERWQEQQQLQKADNQQINPIKIAAILDEFSWECFRYEAKFKALTYSQWEQEMEAFNPQILLVESAWQGKNSSWSNRIARYGKGVDPEVARLVWYCKQKGIPTVFWDKEGMKNFHYFIQTAARFDYVGVTDENVWPIHAAMREQEKVFILPFAAQPRIHHADNRRRYPLGNIAFAGSWYGEKYPKRIREMEKILRPAISFGLDIYDRNYDKQCMLPEDIWKWPSEYKNCIIGKLPYQTLTEVYKQYNIFLNVQSVDDSKWMIPRRVYEILACGIPIISSPSEGIYFQFNGDIYTSSSEEETRKGIIELLGNPEQAFERADRARRKVLREHTYKQRLETILEKVGMRT